MENALINPAPIRKVKAVATGADAFVAGAPEQKKVEKTTYLDRAIADKLEAVAADMGISVASFIAIAVNRELKNHAS